MIEGLSWKFKITQLVKKIPAFLATIFFIIMFTLALHWNLSWTDDLTPHPISPRSIFILFPHIHLGLPSDLFTQNFLSCMFIYNSPFTSPLSGPDICLICITRSSKMTPSFFSLSLSLFSLLNPLPPQRETPILFLSQLPLLMLIYSTVQFTIVTSYLNMQDNGFPKVGYNCHPLKVSTVNVNIFHTFNLVFSRHKQRCSARWPGGCVPQTQLQLWFCHTLVWQWAESVVLSWNCSKRSQF